MHTAELRTSVNELGVWTMEYGAAEALSATEGPMKMRDDWVIELVGAEDRWAMRVAGSGKVQAAADAVRGAVRARLSGKPSECETNAHHCARMAIGKLVQLKFPWRTALSREQGRNYWPVEKRKRPEWVRSRARFERLFEDEKADAVAWGATAPLVPIQVTRVSIGGPKFAELRQTGSYDEQHVLSTLAEAIWEPIRKKSEKYGATVERTMLVLDAEPLPAVFHPGVGPLFRAEYAAHPYMKRWACVLLGSTDPGRCVRLDGLDCADGDQRPIVGISPAL